MSRFKLMVDSDFGPSVADAVNAIGSNVTAKTSVEKGLEPDADDSDLVGYGQNWIVLTHDKTTINERTFPPCKHGGIIIFKEPRWFPETIVASLKKLRQSGKSTLVAHHVTHLFAEKAVIHTHTGKEEIRL